MFIEISIIVICILLLIYSNYASPEGSKLDLSRITFNPYIKPDPCPLDCKRFTFPDDYVTPSIPMTGSCGYRQGSFVFPCHSTCCDRVFSMPGGR